MKIDTSAVKNALSQFGSAVKNKRVALTLATTKPVYSPHKPVLDNDGKVETFAKYNFSYLERRKSAYVLDNDGVPWFLFIAHDGDPANTNLFAARDISTVEGGQDFAFTNTPLKLPGINSAIVEIQTVEQNYLTCRVGGTWYYVKTNGYYKSTASWTYEALPAINNNMLTYRASANHLFSIRSDYTIAVLNNSGTVINSYAAFSLDWITWPADFPRSSVNYAGAGYSIAIITPMGNNEFYLELVFWIANTVTASCFNGFSRFRINPDGTLTWIINPQTAGWKFRENTTNNMAERANLDIVYYDQVSKRFYRAWLSQWQGYYPVSIYRSSTYGYDPKTTLLKTVPIPDTAAISKTSAPGLLVELESDGTNAYMLRSGFDSKGSNIVISRYNNVGGVPKVIPNGLPNGQSFVTANLPAPYPYFTSFCSVKRNNRNELYCWDKTLGKLYRVTLDLATSNVKLTLIRDLFVAGTNFPSATEDPINFMYDPVGNKTYIMSMYKVSGNNGYRLYSVNASNVFTLEIDNIGRGDHTYPTEWPKTMPYVDADQTERKLVFCGSSAVPGGQWGIPKVINLATKAIAAGINYYVYSQGICWSTILNTATLTYADVNNDTKVVRFVLNTNSVITDNGAVVVTLPAPEGLSGFINDGIIHLGGYTTGIHYGLDKAGQPKTFTLPPNATSYLYLTRVGDDQLTLSVSTVNEANTFSKVQIASFVTDGLRVTSTTAKVIDHVKFPF